MINDIIIKNLYIYQYIFVIKNKNCILHLIYIYLGKTSLMYALENGHQDVAKELQKNAAKYNDGKSIYIFYEIRSCFNMIYRIYLLQLQLSILICYTNILICVPIKKLLKLCLSLN